MTRPGALAGWLVAAVAFPVAYLAGLGFSLPEVLAEEPSIPPLAPAVSAQPPPLSDSAPLGWAKDRLLAGFQSTYIWQRKPSMSAFPYPDLVAKGLPNNSLLASAETGYTLSATLLLGARPFRNTEVFVNPETIQSQNISGLHGLGGPMNAEAQKSGGPTPSLYLARAFVRQTIPLGGETFTVESGPNQFASALTRRRLVVTAGNLSILDVFDPNALTHDGRTQFLNWALLTHGAFDYAADARGYTWGLAVEYYHDDWAFRAGRFLGPKESNGLALDFHVFTHYGDSIEIEHSHSLRGRPGKLRLLAFRNHEHMGAFSDAVNAAVGNAAVPSMEGVRRDQSKYGLGFAVDQALTRDASAFVRASWNDGRTETYSFTEIERSLVAGASMRGSPWHRPGDSIGAAWVMNGLSSEHRDYLARGGLGFFIGDGRINYQPEQMVEVYYSAATFSGLWLTLDFQRVQNPAYNADRGPASFLGIRLHLEL
jgi:high affinity Mn2+ porin